MRFQCKYEVDDYVVGYKTYARRGRRKWTTRFLWAMGIGGFAIGIFGSIGPKSTVGPAIPLFLISAYVIYLAATVWARAGRRSFSGRPELAQEYTVDIDDSGVAFNGPISASKWTWPAFIKQLEADKIFLAYLSPCAFVILPKRVLGPGQSDQLRELLRQKLPAR
jgi:YcxB-like protein